MKDLITNIKRCQLCQAKLPLPAKPIFQVSKNSRILIAGQAPGKAAHDTGIPFDDKSGDRLRQWLGVNKAEFYNENLFAILPMGFCYPGKAKSGDCPPLALCADTWRQKVLNKLKNIELIIILGKHAAKWHLHASQPITELVLQWQQLLPQKMVVFPHPSPRNNIWLKKHPEFEDHILPELQKYISSVIRNEKR